MGKQGIAVTVREDVDPEGSRMVELCLEPDSPNRFCYQVHLQKLPVPSYAGRMSRGDDYYGRLEVYLSSGGQDYDVMGYTAPQLIDDVLDQYERHLEFLRLHEPPTLTS
ncbi:hypothetical protein [Nocardioides massiliensis]|uniref:Uncharacterized protein n=1 Tax=Nocardioides massiliensis TaxID=1325935 RepID=A0ABT9NSW4_9ACTN|nr:hypothetical protein [Nocardioides massiliensis]MDP9823367.1 hypothetical protein [Nocardioides massiliensis]